VILLRREVVRVLLQIFASFWKNALMMMTTEGAAATSNKTEAG
jgi:hypothetical protein